MTINNLKTKKIDKNLEAISERFALELATELDSGKISSEEATKKIFEFMKANKNV